MAFPNVTLAILAKDKAHVLPEYLKCIERQTYPKDKTRLYIRTNNNNDDTVKVLKDWLDTVRDKYLEIYLDDSNVPNSCASRFELLSAIRQDSVEWAKKRGDDYFVVDCDNFIFPDVLLEMSKTGLPVVGPMLTVDKGIYSNYHNKVTLNGYFMENPEYYLLYERKCRGLIMVDVINSCYYIRHRYLKYADYITRSCSEDHEYAAFSRNLRKAHVDQYLDNRKPYGYISFCDQRESFQQERFFPKLFWLPPDFNWRKYFELNPDVERAFSFIQEWGAIHHWLGWGYQEGRKYS